MSGIITLSGFYTSSDFSLGRALDMLDNGHVIVLHSNNRCALIFHKCISLKEGKQKKSRDLGTIKVLYKDVGSRGNLLGKNGWEFSLYQRGAFECSCILDDVLRVIWGFREESDASKGAWELIKE